MLVFIVEHNYKLLCLLHNNIVGIGTTKPIITWFSYLHTEGPQVCAHFGQWYLSISSEWYIFTSTQLKKINNYLFSEQVSICFGEVLSKKIRHVKTVSKIQVLATSKWILSSNNDLSIADIMNTTWKSTFDHRNTHFVSKLVAVNINN